MSSVLIESDWNLKNLSWVASWLPFGINRIRLEFKVAFIRFLFDHYRVLIESDWNLKYNIIYIIAVWNSVLIESDWNLKFIRLL